MNGREPYLSAARALLDETGCTVRRWRRGTTGVALLSDPDWAIEVPEPRGPVSYGTFAHEVAHQMLHRPERRTMRRPHRWLEELEAWEWALATFERFGLPGVDQAQADAAKSLAYAADKAVHSRKRDPERVAGVVAEIVARYPEWALAEITHLQP